VAQRLDPKLTFQSLTDALMDECIHGGVHLLICRGIGEMDPVVGGLAPVFFNFTYFSHLNSSMMCANKLFDSTGTSVETLYRWAETHAGQFKFGSAKDVKQAICEARAQLTSLRSVVKCLRIRRNNFLAHNSEESIFNPEGIYKMAGVTYDELKSVFDESAKVINSFNLLWNQQTTLPRLLHQDDFKHVFEMLGKQHCAEIKAHEAEFGIFGLISPRPRGCT